MPIQVIALPVDERAITSAILDALADQISGALVRASRSIRSRVGILVAELIKNTPEYSSILQGKLHAELGVVNAAPVLQAVIHNISEGVLVTSLGARRSGDRIEGGLRVEILKGDYSEVLSAPGGTFKSEGGFDIDWLQWLTREGDRILVLDHKFVAGFAQRSRTNTGVMVKGGSWHVPPEFSGTDEDNWLTRALASIGPALEVILPEEIQRNL